MFCLNENYLTLLFFVKGMRSIRSYRQLYKTQKEKREKDLQKKNQILSQIESLQKELTAVDKEIVTDDINVVLAGCNYYDEKRRKDILNRAEELHYSNREINKIRNIEKNDWNPDTVGIEEIAELDAMEQYVHDNKIWWEKSFIYKVGEFINSGVEEQ